MSFKDSKVPDFFRTHSFDRLALLSGMSEIFSVNGDPKEFHNWSQFTAQLSGDWVSIRYYDPKKQFDEKASQLLYKYLIEDGSSIIKAIKKTWI
jgi:hypothetical protein